MDFKIKDLIVTVLPPDINNPDLGDLCGLSFRAGATLQCRHCDNTAKPPETGRCPTPGKLTPRIFTSGPRELENLKAELLETIRIANEQSKNLANHMRPKSMSEVNSLEEQLKGALEELSKIKKDFNLTIPYWKDGLDECLRVLGERK